MKKIAIITINYNQSEFTIECINSILKSDWPNFEIFLIDNGSKKNNYEKLSNKFGNLINLIRIERNQGYVYGVNLGLKKAEEINPDFFLIMNNDTIIAPDAIRHLIEAGERYDNNAIISGKVYHYDKPNTLQYTGSYFKDKRYLTEMYPGKDEVDYGQYDIEEERDMLDDIFWLLPKKIYKDIGPYSNNFFLYAEQADYALQASKKGYKLIYTPKAKIWHKGCLTTGDGDKQALTVTYWRKKSSIVYLYRNIKKKYFLIFVIKTVLKYLIKYCLCFLGILNIRHKETVYASLIGMIHGLKWVYDPKPDNGFNPFENINK